MTTNKNQIVNSPIFEVRDARILICRTWSLDHAERVSSIVGQGHAIYVRSTPDVLDGWCLWDEDIHPNLPPCHGDHYFVGYIRNMRSARNNR